MRQINMILAAAAAAVVAVSCAKETAGTQSGHDNIPEGFKKVSFTTSAEDTKTTYKGGSVYWEASDKVSLFSGDANVKTELSIPEGKIAEDGSWANFEGLADEAASSYLAVYPSHENNTFDGQTLTVNIPTEQTAVEGGFDSGANVAVAWSEDNSLVFRNAGALIGFRFQTQADATRTEYVTFKMRSADGYCGVTGATTVILDSETKLPMAQNASVDYVKLLPPAGGFVKEKTYFVVVALCEFTGIDVIYHDIYDNDILRSNDMTGSLVRNKPLNIGVIPNPYDIVLPEGDMTLILDFTSKWPFEESIPDKVDGKVPAMSYAFLYETSFKGQSVNVPLYFKFTQSVYSHVVKIYYDAEEEKEITDKKSIKLSSGHGLEITLPGIPGKYLSSVRTWASGRETGKTFKILSKTSSGATNSKNVGDNPALLAFPVGDVNTEEGVAYKMTNISGNNEIRKIEVTYTEELPVATE